MATQDFNLGLLTLFNLMLRVCRNSLSLNVAMHPLDDSGHPEIKLVRQAAHAKQPCYMKVAKLFKACLPVCGMI